MKKLINDPNQVVKDMLTGMVAAHSNRMKLLPDTTVLVRKDAPEPPS